MIRAALIIVALLGATPLFAHERHVHDFIDAIPANVEAGIEKALANAQRKRNQRIDVIVTKFKSDTFRGGAHYEHVDPTSNALEPKTKPDGTRNDNVTLLVSLGDKNVLIAIGNGFPKAYFPLGDEIIGETMIPAFRNGDVPGGIVAGVNEILARLRLDVSPK